MQSAGISKHRGRGAPTPTTAGKEEEPRQDEVQDGALGNLLSVIPPAVRDWLGVSGAAITCCVSSRPPDLPDTRFVQMTCMIVHELAKLSVSVSALESVVWD
mmetsp:Transcript_808/g.2467  ORF Transcript_808/g.2467 Transcript_808/m.2467 type:complete len:102 (-) Transcript_808:802-1107(-)